jgi:LysR family transcriptional regulator, low CO2-responsive transcriptional regulator
MSYAQLKAFHAVAASGGFSKAAHRLKLTQPAVSDHVRKLEATYGVELFSRTRRKVELTDLGRQAGLKLMRLISGERLTGVQRLPCTLVIRESCGGKPT